MDDRLVPECTGSQHQRLQLCRPLPCNTTQTLCSRCRHSWDSETLSEHSADCSQVHQKTVNSHSILNDQHLTRKQKQVSLCSVHKTAHHDQQTSHKHFSHLNKLTFSGIVLKVTLILSLVSLSSAYKPLPWDSWTIKDTPSTHTAPNYANVFTNPTLQIPDLVAVAGHLFSYQISPKTTPIIQYQAREAGTNALPQWLYFNHTSDTFVGVPLSSNKGKVYITLEVHMREEGGSVVVRDTVFSIDVHVIYETKRTVPPLQHNLMPPCDDTRPKISSDQSNDNCQPNYYLHGIPPYPQCSGSRLPVLASLVIIVNITSLSGGQRAALLSTISDTLGICPSRLFVNTLDWTSREGMELWKQLAESGIVDYLDSSTILSFKLSCSPIDYQNEATVACLSRLDQYLTEQPHGIRIFGGSERPAVVPYLRWFVSAGSTVLVSSAPATTENHARLRRQMEDVIVNQPIEMVITTTIPNVISSSAVVSSSLEQRPQQSSTGTAIVSQSISPTATSSDAFGLSSVSLTVTLPKSELPFSLPTSDRPSSTELILSSSALPMTSSDKQSTAISAVSTLSSFSLADSSSIASISVPFGQSSFVSSTVLSSQLIVPPSRVIPTSEVSQTFQTTMLPLTTTIPTTSTATMTTRSLPFVASMDSTNMHVLPSTSVPIMSMVFSRQSALTSMPILSESVSPTRSLPASSILFSIQSSIEDIPTSTQQPLLTTITVSSLSSSFSLPDSFLPTPTPSFSTPTFSQTPIMSTSIPLMTESTSMLLPFETSISSMSSSFIEPTPTLSSMEFTQPSTSILLPETTALSSEVTHTSISMLMPMSSSELTLSISIFTPLPTPSPEPTETAMSSLPFGSQSDIILPSSSSVPSSSPFPSSTSSSIGRPQTSLFITSSAILLPETSTPGPDITSQPTSISSPSPASFVPSPSFRVSSSVEISPTMSTVSMLLPMDSSDMTPSMSIFMPSPSTLLPSETSMFTTELVTETMIFSTLFPTLETSLTSASSPVPSQSISEVISLTETTSMIELFPTSTPVFMPTLFPTPEASSSMSSAIPSQSFPQTMSIIDTSMDFFPTTTPVEISPTVTSLITTPSISSEERPFMTTRSIFAFSSPVEATSTVVTLIMPTLSTEGPLIEVTPTQTLTSFMFTFSTEGSSLDMTSLIDLFPTSTPAMATLTSLFTLVPSPSPSPGPESFCEVNNVNCGNGICLAVNDTFECDCYPDFTGKNCEEIIDNCNPLPCSVNGTSNCTDGNMTFVCTCISGYTGLLCEDEIDSCLSSPCQHSAATCLHLSVGEFVCLCPEGFSGELCETDIDPCSPNPCGANESCINVDNGNFTCIEITISSPVIVESTSFTVDLSSSQMLSQSTASDFTTTIPSSIVTSMTSQTISTPSAISFTRSEVVPSSPFTVIETPTTMSPSIDVSLSTTLETSVEISISTSTAVMSTLEPTATTTEGTVTMRTSSSSAIPFATTMFSSSTNVTTPPPSLPTSIPVPSTTMTTQLPSLPTSIPVPSTTMTTQLPSLPTSRPSPSTVETTVISPSSTVTFSQLPSLTPSASPVNLSPMLLNPIGTLIVNRGQFFQYSIPEATFYDPETGTTSALSLSLLDFRGIPLPNTTWIQLRQRMLEGLPLEAELVNEAITEHLFILRAQDGAGSSAHDFVTLRVLPLGPFSSFLIVPFKNVYEQFNQNLSQKLNLVQRLASYTDPTQGTDIIYVNELRNESMLAISYKNLSIADLNCAEFYQWVESIYSNEEYTQRFIAAMAPAFIPTPTPRVEGTCSITSTNIPPTLLNIDDIESTPISDRVLLLSTVIPSAAVALCCLLVGLCALCMYRRYRSERKYLTSRTLYCNRRPIILEGEVDLPEHRRRPVILTNESALQGAGLLEEHDHHSDSSEDELLCLPPGDRERLLQRPDPPGYRLPPTYARRLLQDDFYDR